MSEFKIIKIIDSKSVIINAGTRNGINFGDEFRIYCLGASVIDPETNENLGYLKITKDIVVVDDLMEKMCICKKKKGLLKNTVQNALQYSGDLLNIDPNDITGGLSTDEPIKVGDNVEQIGIHF